MLNENYIIQKFYQYAGYPKYSRSTNVYSGGCPICREGDSWGRKRRCFYIPKKGYIFCHNCSQSWKPIKWISEVSGDHEDVIKKEALTFVVPVDDLIKQKEQLFVKRNINNESLPKDSINLFDPTQLYFYQNNKVVNDALKFIEDRRLNTAVNKCKSLWLSLTDSFYKNRIIFPYYRYDSLYDIDFYQARAIYPNDETNGKYISKYNSDKTIFNLQNVDINFEYLFLFEGPTDAMFIKNGLALSGVYLTDLQKELLQKFFPFHKIVFVLDNQMIDKTSKEQTKNLLENNYSVFIWPEFLKQFKDFNEICIKQKRDYIPYNLVLNNVFDGVKGKINLPV